MSESENESDEDGGGCSSPTREIGEKEPTKDASQNAPSQLNGALEDGEEKGIRRLEDESERNAEAGNGDNVVEGRGGNEEGRDSFG